jgi:excisionase family DNA binding protein
MKDENFFTPADIANLFKISKAKAYALLKRGEIPSIRIGSLVRVRQEDLLKYIREKAGEKELNAESAKD